MKRGATVVSGIGERKSQRIQRGRIVNVSPFSFESSFAYNPLARGYTGVLGTIMPTRRKNGSSKRKSSKTRRRRRSRTSVKAIVKNEILAASETKRLESTWSKVTGGPGAPYIWLLPSIKQGPTKHNRIGDRIRPLYLNIKGHVVVEETMAEAIKTGVETATGVTLTDKVEQFLFRILVVQRKLGGSGNNSYVGTPDLKNFTELGDTTNLTTGQDDGMDKFMLALDPVAGSPGNLFMRNGQAYNYQTGILETLYADINTNKYHVLYDQVSTMNTMNAKTHFINLNVNLFTKGDKYMKWHNQDDSSSGERWPLNNLLFMLIPIDCEGDNTSTGLLEFNGHLKFAYKDI